MKSVILNGSSLSADDVVNVVRRGFEVSIDDGCYERIAMSRETVESILDDRRRAYGINTGFGKFSDVRISKEESDNVQKNLVRSYACGIGEPFSSDVVLAAMLIKVNKLIKGYSGVRIDVVRTIVDMINKRVVPFVPRDGSGVSGDILPLSHMALSIIGEGEAFVPDGSTGRSVLLPSGEALRSAGIEPVVLKAKEGLSIINGTEIMTAIGVLAVYDSVLAVKAADVSSSMTLEALTAIRDAFSEEIQLLRPHDGQVKTAKNIRALTRGSQLLEDQGVIKLQDAYSLRCIPQVHGVIKESLSFVRSIVEKEMNSITDNPVVFGDMRGVISGGNFHGEYISMALDYLAIAMAELASIAERRIERLVNPSLSGLPGFLTYKGGMNNGFMAAQYSAASVVSENKILSSPACVDNIPSSGNQEDFVSMGTIAAKKCATIVDNVISVIAIEFISSAQGLEFRNRELLGAGTGAAYEAIRGEIPKLDEDRPLNLDIIKARELILSGLLLEKVELESGPIEV
jgi:histidine ammonia-lyase